MVAMCTSKGEKRGVCQQDWKMWSVVIERGSNVHGSRWQEHHQDQNKKVDIIELCDDQIDDRDDQ